MICNPLLDYLRVTTFLKHLKKLKKKHFLKLIKFFNGYTHNEYSIYDGTNKFNKYLKLFSKGCLNLKPLVTRELDKREPAFMFNGCS